MLEIVLQFADPELSGVEVNKPLNVTGFGTGDEAGVNLTKNHMRFT